MSVVYLAIQESLKREVGLKVMRIREGLTDGVAERFIHEAETIAKLGHPNIVGIFDVGQAPDGSLYYTMPHLDHGNLCGFSYAGDDRRLIALLQSLCDGLGYAHEHQVVHRDIKPDNVIFDKFGNAQITDFGIAVSDGNRRWTKEGQVIGSVDYMSPEQCQGGAVDARSDLYSLGIIIWEQLTGEVPFKAEEEMGVMLAQVNNPLPELPWDVRHWQPLLQRCLAKGPDARFQSAAELRRGLGRVPTWFLPRAWARTGATISNWFARWRRRLAIGLGTLLVLTVLAAAVYFWWLANLPAELKPSPPISAEVALTLVDEALEHIDQDRLTRPENDNAADRLVAVLEDHPNHPGALDGMAALSGRYAQLIAESIAATKYAEAGNYADSLAEVWLRSELPRTRFPQVVSAILDSVVAGGDQEIDRFDAVSAQQALAVGKIIEPEAVMLQRLGTRIEKIPEPGERILDQLGVETVFVPRRLQRPDGRSRSADTGFASMPYEVTVSMYRQFAEQRDWPETSCRSRGEAPALFRSRNWRETGIEQNDDHPVICVSWRDAVAFAEWLSARSGHLYRLPTKNEWLHAAWIGHQADSACLTGNVGGTEAADFLKNPLSCKDGIVFTAPVGQFQANRLGLHDLRGNVREWVHDCAPKEPGSRNLLDRLSNKDQDDCDHRMIRGTSWLDGSGVSMMQFSQRQDAKDARSYIGFRLIRDLAAERKRSGG